MSNGSRTDKGRSILAAGAIGAFCGTTLLALGRTLKFLLRDADEDKKLQNQAVDKIETHEES